MTKIWTLFLLLMITPALADDALHQAAFRGDLPAVKALLAGGADPAERDHNGDTALHEAASRSDVQMVRVLLDAGAPVDAPNNQDLRPLYEAAVADSAECCRLLVARGAEVDARCPGDWTALTAALIWGKTRAATVLLEAGAMVGRVQEGTGEMPLMWASQRGPVAMVEELLKRGADPRGVDAKGQTALHHAALGDESEVVAILLAGGAPPDRLDSEGWSALDLALQRGHVATADRLFEAVSAPDHVLPGVCAWGTEEQMAALLEAGANAKLRGADGTPCLAIAAGAWQERGKSDPRTACAKVLLLLQSGASTQADGPEALVAACSHRDHSTVQLLLQNGADPDQRTKNGDYALLVAMEEGDSVLIRELLAAGANPSRRDSSGRGAMERLDNRVASLEERLEQLGRMRSYQPEIQEIGRELERLRSERDALLSLLL